MSFLDFILGVAVGLLIAATRKCFEGRKGKINDKRIAKNNRDRFEGESIKKE